MRRVTSRSEQTVPVQVTNRSAISLAWTLLKNQFRECQSEHNGASASISSHGAVDFTKQAGVRSITFSDANMITAFSNDYGYENWMVKAFDFYSNPGDVLILTSVSGESPSVVLAAKRAIEVGIKVVTFSGRSSENSLRGLGDINFWVDSNAYNIVECIHMMWITTVIDSVIGKSEYEVS